MSVGAQAGGRRRCCRLTCDGRPATRLCRGTATWLGRSAPHGRGMATAGAMHGHGGAAASRWLARRAVQDVSCAAGSTCAVPARGVAIVASKQAIGGDHSDVRAVGERHATATAATGAADSSAVGRRATQELLTAHIDAALTPRHARGYTAGAARIARYVALQREQYAEHATHAASREGGSRQGRTAEPAR